jgi:hypothetical protein
LREREREREKIQHKKPNLYLFKSLGRKEILYNRVRASENGQFWHNRASNF